MAGPKRILIIEDERNIAEMYGNVLTRHNYQVDYSLDGLDGLGKAGKTDYDLILLDIMMPKMSGIEVLDKLREQGATAKVIILTNLAQDEASKNALKAKTDGYVVKAEIVPSQLLEIIDRTLG